MARLLSIFGHPAVTMSLAAVIASQNTSRSTGIIAIASALVLAGIVLAYSQYKAQRGEWKHIDASEKEERAELNLTVGILLIGSSAILYALANRSIALAVGLSGAIVLGGHLLSTTCKPSLHVAFAVFSAILVWPTQAATAVLATLALGVAWSRLALSRHTLLDVLVGALLGTISGFAFQITKSYF